MIFRPRKPYITDTTMHYAITISIASGFPMRKLIHLWIHGGMSLAPIFRAKNDGKTSAEIELAESDLSIVNDLENSRRRIIDRDSSCSNCWFGWARRTTLCGRGGRETGNRRSNSKAVVSEAIVNSINIERRRNAAESARPRGKEDGAAAISISLRAK